ncbi:unnamed protein product [Orchesella dallaii]|uniref:Uncharacterized protein n=1 Tax=Orchesella dallaii TaxID=48710 RepID=A0ABP1QEF8_9HEXA
MSGLRKRILSEIKTNSAEPTRSPKRQFNDTTTCSPTPPSSPTESHPENIAPTLQSSPTDSHPQTIAPPRPTPLPPTPPPLPPIPPPPPPPPPLPQPSSAPSNVSMRPQIITVSFFGNENCVDESLPLTEEEEKAFYRGKHLFSDLIRLAGNGSICDLSNQWRSKQFWNADDVDEVST